MHWNIPLLINEVNYQFKAKVLLLLLIPKIQNFLTFHVEAEIIINNNTKALQCI